jgi:hypothetical protein
MMGCGELGMMGCGELGMKRWGESPMEFGVAGSQADDERADYRFAVGLHLRDLLWA